MMKTKLFLLTVIFAAFSANGFEGKKVDIDAEKEMTVKLKPKAK